MRLRIVLVESSSDEGAATSAITSLGSTVTITVDGKVAVIASPNGMPAMPADYWPRGDVSQPLSVVHIVWRTLEGSSLWATYDGNGSLKSSVPLEGFYAGDHGFLFPEAAEPYLSCFMDRKVRLFDRNGRVVTEVKMPFSVVKLDDLQCEFDGQLLSGLVAGHSSSVGKTTLVILNESLAEVARETVNDRFTSSNGAKLWRANNRGVLQMGLQPR